MRKHKSFTSLIIVFAGLIFLFAGAFITAKTADFRKNGVRTQAVITDIDGHYDSDGDYVHDVFVTFNVSGTEYSGKLNAYEARFKVGMEVPVLYKPENPRDFIYDNHNAFLAFIMFLAGGLVIVSGLYKPVSEIVLKIKINSLKKTGRTVLATVRMTEIRGKGILDLTPTVISCIDETGRLYEKKMLIKDGSVKVGDAVMLYVDREDDEKFVIDLDGVRLREELSERK